jgi:hypothetical protein
MNHSSRVAKSRKSTAVPAVPAPFIPASIPGTDLHWRKAASRKAKAAKPPRSASADRSSDRRTKNKTSEYEEKFVEWELPEKQQAHAARQYAPTGFYERDMNESDWKSEHRRNFPKKELGSTADRAAGVPRGGQSHAPTWYVEDESLNQYNEGAQLRGFRAHCSWS